eukprot:12121497-Alexandrium_andersonii.AAC.1
MPQPVEGKGHLLSGRLRAGSCEASARRAGGSSAEGRGGTRLTEQPCLPPPWHGCGQQGPAPLVRARVVVGWRPQQL